MPVPAAYTSLTSIGADAEVSSSLVDLTLPTNLESAVKAIVALQAVVRKQDVALVTLTRHLRQNRERDVRAIQDLQQTWNTFRTQYLIDHP